MKKKILFCTSSTTGGGAERMLFNIIQSLNSSYEKQLLITSDAKIPSYISLENTEVINCYKKSAKYSFPAIIKQIISFAPDYIFTTSYNIGYLLILAKLLLRSKTKVIIRCAVSPSEIYNKSDFKECLLKKIQSLTYNKAHIIIAQTDFMKRDIEINYHVRAEKVKTIRNIINIEEVTEKSARFVPDEFSKGNYNIVAAGALYSVKGFDLLIQALEEIVVKYPQVRLYILGKERNEIGYQGVLEKIIEKCNLSNHVSLLGQKSNPYPYIKHASLLAMTSRKEGFPNVVLEALTLKTPVLATNCVDFTNVIFEGVNGYIVQKNLVESIKIGIEQAIKTTFDMECKPISNFDYNNLFV